MSVYVLSEDDRAIFREIADEFRGRKRSGESGRARPSDSDDQLPPETYVALTPEEGIPKLEGAQLGHAECKIHRVFDAGGEVRILVPITLSKTVYNLDSEDVPGNAWVLVGRDKFGTWFSLTPGNPNTQDQTGTGSYFTGTGSSPYNPDPYPGYADVAYLADICWGVKWLYLGHGAGTATGTGPGGDLELRESFAYIPGGRKVYDPDTTVLRFTKVRIPRATVLERCVALPDPTCCEYQTGTGTDPCAASCNCLPNDVQVLGVGTHHFSGVFTSAGDLGNTLRNWLFCAPAVGCYTFEMKNIVITGLTEPEPTGNGIDFGVFPLQEDCTYFDPPGGMVDGTLDVMTPPIPDPVPDLRVTHLVESVCEKVSIEVDIVLYSENPDVHPAFEYDLVITAGGDCSGTGT